MVDKREMTPGQQRLQKTIDEDRLWGLYRDSSKNSKNYLIGYGSYLSELLSTLDYDSINKVVDCFLDARENDATIYFAGNGGSAATASHFAQDLCEVGRKTNAKMYRGVSISDNISFISAMANDYGFDHIFTEQMSNLFKKGDILVVISASGNSPNLVEAANMAKELGGTTVGLVGFDGGRLSTFCDYVIHVKSNKGEFGLVEDVHMALDHMITSCLMWIDYDSQNGGVNE